jgi:hypothetical protein
VFPEASIFRLLARSVLVGAALPVLLRGPFASASGSAGEGAIVGGEVYKGESNGNAITGGNLFLGVGGGTPVSGTAGPTFTWVKPW